VGMTNAQWDSIHREAHRRPARNKRYKPRSKQSRYLIPDPVLKITTRSPMAIFPDARSFLSAAKQAAPSGATKRPSWEPTSRTVRIISSSSTAIAPPFDSQRMFSIKKSPIAFGTRKPDARSEEHTSELQSRGHLVCRLLL